MNKVKVQESKIHGLGLFADQEFNEGDMIGLAHYNGVPSEIIGKYHNHSDNPNAHSVTIGNKRFLVALNPLRKGEEITVDYREQPELEQPEEFAKGGLVNMPKPSKKGLASKRYSRDLTATNRLFTKNNLLQKPKSKKRKIYDPNAKYYQEGGESNDRKFKRNLMKEYPGMQDVYGRRGRKLNIVEDPNYDAKSAGYGDIEFQFPVGDREIIYDNLVQKDGPEYVYPNPSPNKYTALYNPRGANRGDVFLDMMHGMRDDKNYLPLLENFEKAVMDARGEDMSYYYDQQVKDGYKGGQEQWNKNYIDGILRAELSGLDPLAATSFGSEDYAMERQYSSDDVRNAAQDIYTYLKTKHRDGGQLDTYPKGGRPGKPKKGEPKNVQPYVTSDPAEYAYRKAAYDDSLYVANKYNRYMPSPDYTHTWNDKDTHETVGWRKPKRTKHSVYYFDDGTEALDGNKGAVSPAWKNYERSTNYERNIIDYPYIYNKPVAVEEIVNYFPKDIYRRGTLGHFLYGDGTELDSSFDNKYRYQPPRQKIIFQEPPKPKSKSKKQGAKKVEEKPKVIEPTLIPQPIPTPIPQPTPIVINPELQKFVEEKKPEPPGPPPGLLPKPGTDVMPVYAEQDDYYNTPDGGAEWVGKTKRYIDWDGNSFGYRLPEFKKPGHGGPLLKPGTKHYLYYPSIESRYQAEIIPEEEFKKGGGLEGDEPKKKKRDAKPNYSVEDKYYDTYRTNFTSEDQALMPSDEWAQYVQEVKPIIVRPSTERRNQYFQDREDKYGYGKDDSLLENIVEFVDPTGISSHDDFEGAFREWILSENKYPTLGQSIEMFGAVPFLGKFGKIKYLANAPDAMKAVYKTIPWQQIINAYDTQDDIRENNIPKFPGYNKYKTLYKKR